MSSAVADPEVAAVLPQPPFPHKTLEELLHELGDIPADRVLLFPQPGTATEADAYWVNQHRAGGCELINGTLVQKPMGVASDYLGFLLGHLLMLHVLPARLGMVVTARAQFRMLHGNIREPDVSFTLRSRLPNPLPQVGGWCPDICVEILSPGNTEAEMAMKRDEFFASGCRLMWVIAPPTRTAEVYTDPTTVTHVDETGTLDGGDVLPGFALPLRDLFAELDALTAPPATPGQ